MPKDRVQSRPVCPFSDYRCCTDEPFPSSRDRYRQRDLHPVGGGIDLSHQGILKFTDPHRGVLRFDRIGFPYPDFTAHFVGILEIVCGFLVLIGVFTRLASIPLLVIILTAIASAKIPELWRPAQGFWFMVSTPELILR
jgi:uncharacterized membrane protein